MTYLSSLRLVCLVFLLTPLIPSQAQPPFDWASHFGGTNEERPFSIASDPGENNVYSTGFFKGTVDFDPGPGSELTATGGNSDLYIQKMARSGAHVWTGHIKADGGAKPRDLVMDSSDAVIVAGDLKGTADLDPATGTQQVNSSNSSWDAFIVKISPSGALIWSVLWGGPDQDHVSSVTIGPNGNIYVTGGFKGTADLDPGTGTEQVSSSGSWDAYVTKLAPDGDHIWSKSMGDVASDKGRSIAIDDQGDLLLTGRFQGNIDTDPGGNSVTQQSNGNKDIFLTKWTDAGNHLWSGSMGGPDNDKVNSLSVDGDGNVITSGFFYENGDFNPTNGTHTLNSAGYRDIYVCKVDSSGQYEWSHRIGASLQDRATAVVCDDSGNVHMSGMFEDNVDFDPNAGTHTLSSAGGRDAFVGVWNPDGSLDWVVSMGGSGYDLVPDLHPAASGNIYTTGHFQNDIDMDPSSGTYNFNSAGGKDFFVQKLGENRPSSIFRSTSRSSSFQVHPNPSQGWVALDYARDLQGVEVQVLNAQGKELREHREVRPGTRIELPEAPGIYFLHLQSDSWSEVRKVIKQAP